MDVTVFFNSRITNFILDSKNNSTANIEGELSALGLPESYCKKLSELISNIEAGSEDSISLPRFTSCSWSLDVAISSSRMLKLLEPSVRLFLQSGLEQNSEKSFQVQILTIFNLTELL